MNPYRLIFLFFFKGTLENDQLHFYYLQMFQNTNTYYDNSGMDITFDEFKSNFSLFTFCNTASNIHIPGFKFCIFQEVQNIMYSNFADTIPLVRNGNSHMRIQFRKPTPQANLYTMCWAGIFPTLLAVDKNRSITVSHRTA